MNKFIKQDDGFTLIEVIIAIQLTLIVISFVYVIYFYANQYMKNYSETAALDRKMILMQKVLSSELFNAREIFFISGESIQYKSKNYVTSNLFYNSDSIYLNTQSIAGGVEISSVLLFYNEDWHEYKELDSSGDGILDRRELKDVSLLRLEYIVREKRYERGGFITIPIPERITLY